MGRSCGVEVACHWHCAVAGFNGWFVVVFVGCRLLAERGSTLFLTAFMVANILRWTAILFIFR
ncbi:hypothetical protein V8C34DRAFT_290262 [Trichoderma compactum]